MVKPQDQKKSDKVDKANTNGRGSNGATNPSPSAVSSQSSA